MQDKEYLIETKIKNNKLYQLIMKESTSIKDFCEKHNLCSVDIYKLMNFKYQLYKRTGELRKVVVSLLEIFNCKLEDIIPINYYVRETNKFLTEVTETEMLSLSDMSEENLLALTDQTTETTEDQYIRKDNISVINNVLEKTLTPRERFILVELEANNSSSAKLAKALGITRTRVYQIRDKAIRKLKHPSRWIKLKNCL